MLIEKECMSGQSESNFGKKHKVEADEGAPPSPSSRLHKR